MASSQWLRNRAHKHSCKKKKKTTTLILFLRSSNTSFPTWASDFLSLFPCTWQQILCLTYWTSCFLRNNTHRRMTETGRKDETLGTAFVNLSVYIITNQTSLKGSFKTWGLGAAKQGALWPQHSKASSTRITLITRAHQLKQTHSLIPLKFST